MMSSILRSLSVMLAVPVVAATPLPPTAPARDRACVPFAAVTTLMATDDGHLLFRGETDPKRSYVAVFKGGRCLGLDRFATVQVEPRTTRGYCGGDQVRVFRPPVTVAGPVCEIDHLRPVDAAAFD